MDPILLIIMIVVVAVIAIRPVVARHTARLQSEAQLTPYGSPQPVSHSTTPAVPIADELIKLHALKTSGALTEREFAEAKARLLNGR
jgi:hypothetical protein